MTRKCAVLDCREEAGPGNLCPKHAEDWMATWIDANGKTRVGDDERERIREIYDRFRRLAS